LVCSRTARSKRAAPRKMTAASGAARKAIVLPPSQKRQSAPARSQHALFHAFPPRGDPLPGPGHQRKVVSIHHGVFRANLIVRDRRSLLEINFLVK
jgi:hypothetical protein